ncbi:DUF3263 domain-containing protein [Corynebacterium halotolerans]|uniref:DUF3263 domain-containing protein n=1 Tax=Corynebacterium halotolerans TaxID=225326 RepID=UPI003CEB07AC
MPELDDFDARLLDFEEHAPRSLGAKEEAIRKQLGISPVRYYQRLNLLIDAPAAMAEHPVLTARLRRIRDQREQERQGAREVE